MNNWWQSYQSKSSQNRKNLSIAKDEVALLDERLKFFIPTFNDVFTPFEAGVYILAWSLFITGTKLGSSIFDWHTFIVTFLIEALVLTVTLIPSIVLIELQKQFLKNISKFQACVRVIATTVFMGAFASLLILFSSNLFGVIQWTIKEILLETLINTLNIAGFTTVILIYYLRRFRELSALKMSFEQKLKTQNDHIKARLAPHFFFNTVNTLTSLVEADCKKAGDFLQHFSHLFRSSFSDPKESNFEEEIELCQHYLAIESYRLQDKLKVTWDLPDEALIYDMSITSFVLQNILEQTILHVVEMTTDTVHVHVKASWENHRVSIVISANIPKNMFVIRYNIESHLNFKIQEERLQLHFGSSAKITTLVENNHIINTISYPLHDAFM